MSAANGGRGKPPVPPEGHGPPPEQPEVPIFKDVTYTSLSTEAERAGQDGACISFVVVDGGQQVRHNYLVSEPGKKALLEALSGGLTLP